MSTPTQPTQAELEALYLQQEQIAARHSVKVMKALISNALALHEVDFTSLSQKVNSIHNLLDGDELAEGYQTFAALSEKLNGVELTGVQNSQAILQLQSSINSQIATMVGRVDTVENEARTGREALDVRISQLRTEYETHVAASLAKNNDQDTKLDDHRSRIEALESAKVLSDDRLGTLELDSNANKSAISQIQTTLQTQAAALQQELERAQIVEAELRGEIVTERARIDGLVTDSGSYLTRKQAASAQTAGATAFCTASWEEAGLPMPPGLDMPDGSVSA